MKKQEVIGLFVILTILVLLFIPITSANIFSNIFDKITGYATSDTAVVNVTIGNSIPTIPFVQAISSKNPTDDSTTSITFNFTATDTDGDGNLNDSTATAYFQRTGESTRSNTSCVQIYPAAGNSKNYTCTIDMWYYDQNGAWTVNATIKDINDAYVENASTTFTYNLLPNVL